MLQHVRCRRTVRWAILRHRDDQITKGIYVRLREPQLPRSELIDRFLQRIITPNSPADDAMIFQLRKPQDSFEQQIENIVDLYSRVSVL